jgi:hypothetical protein
VIKKPEGTLGHLNRPGLLVPGPPLHMMRRPDEDGLTDATSNDGNCADWL